MHKLFKLNSPNIYNHTQNGIKKTKQKEKKEKKRRKKKEKRQKENANTQKCTQTFVCSSLVLADSRFVSIFAC